MILGTFWLFNRLFKIDLLIGNLKMQFQNYKLKVLKENEVTVNI